MWHAVRAIYVWPRVLRWKPSWKYTHKWQPLLGLCMKVRTKICCNNKQTVSAQTGMRTAIAEITDARDDEALLVKPIINLGGDDGDLWPLRGQCSDALWCGDEVEEEDLLFLYAMIQENLDGLPSTAASSSRCSQR